VSQKYLRHSGRANQLAQQAGMDNKTSAKSLPHVLHASGTQMGERTMENRQKLAHLTETPPSAVV
jgi:hypothetical protein